jgi:nitrogen regulatory protein PII
MKKIEAVIDRAGLEALEIHLAQAGIDGPAALTQISIVETPGRFYGLQEARDRRWKHCVKFDVFVSDSEAQSTVNMILQHANVQRFARCGGHVDIVPLDAVREISA